MNAATVSRVLSLIPDRIVRLPSGSTFDAANATACAHPERITHLVQFLSWLAPLNPITKDDLRVFGLMTPYGKPAVDAAPEEEGDAELELEPELDVPVPASAGVVEPRAEATLP